MSERVHFAAMQSPPTEEKSVSAATETEMERLTRLLREADSSLRQQECQMVNEISNCMFLDRNLEKLPQLRKAKLAVSQILRAAKKDDFMLLSSDECPEIKDAKSFVPGLIEFTELI